MYMNACYFCVFLYYVMDMQFGRNNVGALKTGMLSLVVVSFSE